MELSQLRYFVAIVEHGGMSRAAAALFTTQPNLSASLKKLENDLGFKLFDRSSGKLELTEGGQHFLNSARAALNMLEVGASSGKRAASTSLRRVSVAATVNPFLFKHMHSFLEKNPDVCVVQQSVSQDEIERGIIEQRIDFAVTYRTIDHPLVGWEPLASSGLCLLVGASSPLAQLDSVSVNMLKHEDFIVGDSNNSSITNDVCARERFIPRIICEAHERPLQDYLLQKGLGIQLAPKMEIRSELFDACEGRIKLLQLADCPDTVELGFCFHKYSLSETAKELMAAMRDSIREEYRDFVI